MKNGVSRTSRKYNKSRSYIYFWLNRYDGTMASLKEQSRRPKSHPNQHTPEEIKLIQDMRRRNPKLGIVLFWLKLRARGYTRTITGLFRIMQRLQLFEKRLIKKKYVAKPYEQMTYPGERVQIDVKTVPLSCRKGEYPYEKYYQYTAIDEYSRMRVVKAYKEQSTYSSAQFLRHVVAFFKRRRVTVECIQTDNGKEFTNRFSSSRKDSKTMFELAAAELGIRHKLIRPYTPRHNGKVERSHREDQKRFYDTHSFYSFDDFDKQLAAYQSRTNKIPMRPLRYLSPAEVLLLYAVQYV